MYSGTAGRIENCQIGVFLGYTAAFSRIFYRGISQEKLLIYLRLFEFIYNVKKRGKALLRSLL